MLLLVEAAEDPADVGRDLASGHAKTPRRGSGPLTAPAAAAKEEQLAQHNNQQCQSSGLRRCASYRPSEPGLAPGPCCRREPLELLLEREPQLEAIETYNAETNAHMVGINETLGYRVTGRLTFWQMPAAAAS